MLEEFIKFLVSKGRDTTLALLNPVTVREFIVAQQDKGLSPFTVACGVRALRAFSSWLLLECYTEDNVLVTIKPPKTPNKMIEVITPSEIEKLIGSQNLMTALGSRNVALLTTPLDSGLRISEICNL